MSQTNLIKIKRFNDVNTLGIDENSYNELFSKEAYKTMVECNLLGCELFLSKERRRDTLNVMDPTRYCMVPLENMCCRLLKIEDDYIGVTLTDSNAGRVFLDLLKTDPNNLEAYARVLGVRNEETNLMEVKKFICFDIIYTGNLSN